MQRDSANFSLPLPEGWPLSIALEQAVAIGRSRATNLSAAAYALRHALRPTRLAELEVLHAAQYHAAKPFPHTVIDRLLPDWIIQSISEEMPETYFERNVTKRFAGCYDKARSYEGKDFYCASLKGREVGKSSLQSENSMGPYTIMVFRALKSVEFTAFLARLSSLERPLYPDPAYEGSGASMISPGGYLGLHADFNVYRKYSAARRVNTFLFLNREWPDVYGGHLELWNRELTRCDQRILPIWNRFVVFSTTDFSWHGHPSPLTTPHGRMRRSLALYFYSKGRPVAECLDGDCSGDGHGTIFAKRSLANPNRPRFKG